MGATWRTKRLCGFLQEQKLNPKHFHHIVGLQAIDPRRWDPDSLANVAHELLLQSREGASAQRRTPASSDVVSHLCEALLCLDNRNLRPYHVSLLLTAFNAADLSKEKREEVLSHLYASARSIPLRLYDSQVCPSKP